MARKILILFVLLALLLTACNSANPGGEIITLEPGETAPEAPADNAAGATAAPSGEGDSGGQTAAISAPAGCTVISLEPTPGPTEQSAFPPIGPEDWVQGPSDATISFVEYGDFQ